MRQMLLIVIIVSFFTILTGCNLADKIEVYNPSFMYTEDSSIEEKVDVLISGFYYQKDEYIKGSMRLNSTKLEHILFFPND